MYLLHYIYITSCNIKNKYKTHTYDIMTMTIANPPFIKVKFVLFNIVITI